MKKKYPIRKEFSSIAGFTPPLAKPVFPIARGFLRCFTLRSDDLISVSKKRIVSKDGSVFQSLWIEPKNGTEKMPCLVYFPGGGFVFRAAPYHYRLVKQYALKAQCKVLLVHYRLAPKYKFPLALEDACFAYRWVLQNADMLGVDENRIALGGDSAGGNLAAACALALRDNGEKQPCFQMLIYPVLDAEMRTESMQKYTDTPMWNAKSNKKMWKYYLSDEREKCNPYVCPLCAKDLSDLPKTYLEVAQFDCLRDEGLAYADKLAAFDVLVTLYETEGTVHGFEFVSKSESTQAAVENRAKVMKSFFYGQK